MQIFLDTAEISEVKDLVTTGLIDGITTNPSLVAGAGKPFTEILKELSTLITGPISAEVTATDASEMILQGKKLAALAENIVIKVPLTMDGLKACKTLSDDGIMVNVTLCFSAPQALLAAKAGAAFISPFVGRLDDNGWDGMQLIRDICQIYGNYYFQTAVLAASIRHPQHVLAAAMAGADVVTIPPKVFRQLYQHPLTDKGLDAFLKDWQQSGLEI